MTEIHRCSSYGENLVLVRSITLCEQDYLFRHKDSVDVLLHKCSSEAIKLIMYAFIREINSNQDIEIKKTLTIKLCRFIFMWFRYGFRYTLKSDLSGVYETTIDEEDDIVCIFSNWIHKCGEIAKMVANELIKLSEEFKSNSVAFSSEIDMLKLVYSEDK